MRLIIPALALVGLAACGEAPTVELQTEETVDPVAELAETGVSAEGVLETVEAEYGDAMMAEAVPMEAVEAGLGEEALGEEGTPVAALEPVEFELQRGETLAHFARWAELPVEVIAETSELDLAGAYPVGTVVIVPVGDEQALDRLMRLRSEHHDKRLTAYLDSRGGSLGEEVVQVRTGDTAWSLARDHHGLPVWVIDQLNPDVDLEHLRPGDQLMVPVLADIVAEAEPEAE